MVMRRFGCLAGALKNIHQRNIKDITAEKTLVHGENVVIVNILNTSPAIWILVRTNSEEPSPSNKFQEGT
jgi:hypothetical protein